MRRGRPVDPITMALTEREAPERWARRLKTVRAQVITLMLDQTHRDTTHWSMRAMAKAYGLGQTAVSRIWRAFALQPHRTETFKLSKAPLFIETVWDIVGLHLNPPDKALVLCTDEKTRSRPWIERNRCC